MAADTEESISVCQCLWKQREGQQVSEILCFILAVVLPGRETVCVYFCKVALWYLPDLEGALKDAVSLLVPCRVLYRLQGVAS